MQLYLLKFLHNRGVCKPSDVALEFGITLGAVEASGKWGCELVDFTTIADYDNSPGRYIFFVEVKNPAVLAGMSSAKSILEEALGRANPRYLAGRRAGRLGPLALQVVGLRPGAKVRLPRRGRGDREHLRGNQRRAGEPDRI